MRTVLFTVFVIILTANLAAQIPNTLSWQGLIQDAEGNNLSGAHNITVKIYDVSSGGTALWTEQHNNLQIEDGLANIILGEISNLNITFNKQYWLEITVGTGTPLSRIKLTSVPYSLYSKTADALSGGITENDPTWNGNANQTGNIGRVGNVGIGTTSPSQKLDIDGLLRIRGGNPGLGKVLSSDESGVASWTSDGLQLPFYATGSEFWAIFSITNTNYAGIGVKGNGVWGVYGESDEYGVGVSGYGGTGVEGVSNTGTAVLGRIQTSGRAIEGKVTDLNSFSGHFSGGKFYISSQVGIGTTTPSALLHVHGTSYSGGNVVFTGEYLDSYLSQAPVEGSGTRMMWYPNMAAFRAGRVSGTQWNKSNMGDYSTAFGYDTKASGYASMAFGEKANASNTLSTAMGFNTTASGNVSTATGYSTTASGYAATSVGYYTTAKSGYETVVGCWNTDYTPASTAGWNANDRLFVIGNGAASGSRSNAVTVLKNGRVGIGPDNPGAGLHLKGSGYPGSFMYLESNTGQDAGFRLYEGNTEKWHIFNNSNDAGLTINNNAYEIALFAKQSNAFIGLGINNPTQRLDVNGNARFRSIASGAYFGVVNRTSDGTLTTATSDIRLKENISTLENCLARIMQLRGVSFTWKDNPEYGTRIGFVAQEFEKVLPELAFTNPTDGYMGINYAEVTAVIIEAMKEQQLIIEEQNKSIEDLQSQLKLLLQVVETK